MELPRLAEPRRTRALPSIFSRCLLGVALTLLALALPATAAAAGTSTVSTAPANPGAPVLVTKLYTPPAGYTLTAAHVLQIASSDPRVKAELARHPHSTPYEYTKGGGTWQVSWFSPEPNQRELLQVYVDDATGTVTQVWTGFQVAWTMARGYAGAFGRRSNALYVWLPLCVLFFAPFIPWPGRRRPTLLHLDLLMLLGFSISLAFFNHSEIGLSVPLVYPFLLYLLIRMLLLAFGKGRPREPLTPIVSSQWLLSGFIFLMALRIGLNIMNSNVIDVGYAGVIGADKLIHGHMLYGLWPHDNAYGDTYGPVNYFAYVPFRLIFGWSGTWDALPAAHAAAIVFDLLTVAGLYRLGRRLRGHELGVILIYAWVAYPFTLFTLSSNSNDALVAALVVGALLAIDSAPRSGFAAALAGLTKFAPFALAPLLLRGTGPPRPRRKSVVFALAFAATVLVCMAPVLLHDDLHYFWHDSVAYQSNRITPFSIWGLWGGLGAVQHLLEGAAVGLGILVAFVPQRRGALEVAALGAAVLIALQVTANYWLYPYIVWFFPLVAVTIFAVQPSRQAGRHPDPELGGTRDPEPILVQLIPGPGTST